MTFQNQFSLSLELTKLVPLGLSIAGKTYETAMKLARELQNSGSDIVVEEDLAELFGRSRISITMASSFRTIVSKSEDTKKLFEGVSLHCGPGPTVLRGLTQPPYFSTVLQCSFLTFVHEKDSLAAAITLLLQKQAEGSPNDCLPRAVPSMLNIRGVLQACEDQTSAYDWFGLLNAVGQALGLSELATMEPIPPAVFQGLVSMLPLVQHFPEDRLIIVQLHTGVCSVVVWAHHILDLSVLVKLKYRELHRDFRFGSAPEQVVIEATLDDSNGASFALKSISVTLLSSESKEALFKIKSDPDEDEIEGTYKTTAKGFGKRIFSDEIFGKDGARKVVSEMGLITCAFALCISNHLIKAKDWQPGIDESAAGPSTLGSNLAQPIPTGSRDQNETIQNGEEEPSKVPYFIPKQRILQSACLIFDQQTLDEVSIRDYTTIYSGRSLLLSRKPPKTILPILEEWGDVKKLWSTLCAIATNLAPVILAFAHVTNIENSGELPISDQASTSMSDLAGEIVEWDGQTPIPMRHNSAFEIMAFLMVGHCGDSEFPKICLVSDRGWSVYMSTLGNSDPSYTNSGYVVVQRGVPCRQSIWKHRIKDGPEGRYISADSLPWNFVGTSGQDVRMDCLTAMEYDTPLIGERGDSFVVSLRLKLGQAAGSPTSLIKRTGYFELSSALWISETTKSCNHRVRVGDTMRLAPGWVAIAGSPRGLAEARESSGQLIICCTASNTAARWGTLIDIWDISGREYGFPQVKLRGHDCCFKCAADQTIRKNGVWYLVL